MLGFYPSTEPGGASTDAILDDLVFGLPALEAVAGSVALAFAVQPASLQADLGALAETVEVELAVQPATTLGGVWEIPLNTITQVFDVQPATVVNSGSALWAKDETPEATVASFDWGITRTWANWTDEVAISYEAFDHTTNPVLEVRIWIDGAPQTVSYTFPDAASRRAHVFFPFHPNQTYVIATEGEVLFGSVEAFNWSFTTAPPDGPGEGPVEYAISGAPVGEALIELLVAPGGVFFEALAEFMALIDSTPLAALVEFNSQEDVRYGDFASALADFWVSQYRESADALALSIDAGRGFAGTTAFSVEVRNDIARLAFALALAVRSDEFRETAVALSVEIGVPHETALAISALVGHAFFGSLPISVIPLPVLAWALVLVRLRSKLLEDASCQS